MTSPLLRVVEREAQVYRRLWRASAFTSFVIPVLFLAAIGVGLGGLVDQRTRNVGDTLGRIPHVRDRVLLVIGNAGGDHVDVRGDDGDGVDDLVTGRPELLR